jgi:hypothetical protein
MCKVVVSNLNFNPLECGGLCLVELEGCGSLKSSQQQVMSLQEYIQALFVSYRQFLHQTNCNELTIDNFDILLASLHYFIPVFHSFHFLHLLVVIHSLILALEQNFPEKDLLTEGVNSICKLVPLFLHQLQCREYHQLRYELKLYFFV